MSFATSHSRSFERLSRDLLAQQLDIPADNIVLTQANKDGGADGYREIGIGTIFGQDLRYSLAFEAKLRSPKSNPGLDIFAKAMVVAFNTRRHGLAITTNRLFTPQCLKEAAQFHFRTGLQFIFVDGPRVSLWIRPRLAALLAQGYENEFLEGLLWRDDRDALRDNHSLTTSVPCEAGVIPPLQISVRHGGPHAQEQLVGHVEARLLSAPVAQRSAVLGVERKRTLEALRSAIAGGDGLHILWGEAGVGKSLAIASLVHDFAARGWSISCINLRTCFTARDLFLKLLASLCGYDLSLALAEIGRGRARNLLAQLLGATEAPAQALDAAAAALTSHRHPDRAPSELDHSLLLGVLDHALAQRRDGHIATSPPVALIVLQEPTYATPEIFDFPSRALGVIGAPGVKIVLESRPHDMRGEESSRHWEAFRLALAGATASESTLSAFSRADARGYLLDLLPGIGAERADFIIDRIGTIPLFIETARDYLVEQGAVFVHAGRYTTVEDLPVFFEGIRPERPAALIRLQIEHWAGRFEDMFHAAALLDGRLSPAAVGAVAEGNADALLDGALKTGLFEPLPYVNGVQVRHGLILDELKAFAEAGPFARRRAALALLARLDALELDLLTRRAHEADLKAAAGLIEEAVSLSHAAGKAFWQQHQLSLGVRYLRQAHQLARMLAEHPQSSPRPAAEQWEILLDLLDLQDQRHQLAAEETTHRLEDATLIWRQPEVLAAIKTGDLWTLRLRAGYVLWRADHLRERFSAAEAVGRLLFETAADAAARAASVEVAGKAFSALGITLKALGMVEESRDSFERARRLCPASVELTVQHYANEAALRLGDDPESALAHFDEILALTSAKSAYFLPHLHAQVDRAMALFLMRRYPDACGQAHFAERLASANAVAAQTARAQNVLGCCSWSQGNVPEARQFFERAVLDAERSFSDRFLWRMRANLSAVAFEQGHSEAAAANAASAARRILGPRRGAWPNRAGAATRRWYHALLLCGAVLDRLGERDLLDDIVAEVPFPEFREQVASLVQGRMPEPVGNSSSVHAGRIMITG
jgi:tetratricopeptide (TPR) repeat protein